MAASLLWNADEDELYALQYHQAMLESIQAVRGGNAWPAVGGILQSRQAAHTRTLAGSNGMNRFRYLLSAMMVPNTSKAVQTTVRHETQRRLTVTALALKRYQLRLQRLPEKLDELVPEFLAAVPVDPMDAQPLRYRRESGSEFVLYSVGEDGKDDGGKVTPTVKTAAYEIWSGLDFVWPKPAD